MKRRTVLAMLAVIAAGCTREPATDGKYLAALSLYGGRGSAIKAVGLEPECDWPALAQAHLKSMPRRPADGAKMPTP